MSTRGVKGKSRKRRPKGKPDNPAQSKRFIEAARKLGADLTSSKEFEHAFRAVVKRKPKDGSS